MTTAELIAQLHAVDPGGKNSVAIQRIEWPTDGCGGIDRREVHLTRIEVRATDRLIVIVEVE